MPQDFCLALAANHPTENANELQVSPNLVPPILYSLPDGIPSETL